MSLLATHALDARYGDFQALWGVEVTLDAGETVAIIGANGAGKTTFLRSIAGVLAARPNAVMFDGRAIGGMSAHRIVALGIASVPEGRLLFPSLTVEENLLIGGHSRRKGPWTLDRLYRLFPILRERRHQLATTMSGGQQQMAAIGRALMANPRLLLCDEISLGLAPVVIRDIYAILSQIGADGTSLIVVEQDINLALKVADRIYCFQEGRVSLEGRPADIVRDDITRAYFGV